MMKMAGEGLELAGQVVLVLQGGGALGAYQVGVFQAMHEAGIEPDWIIGTSIGAINGAIIAGNPPAERMRRLDAFWEIGLSPWDTAAGTLLITEAGGMVGTLHGGDYQLQPHILAGTPKVYTPLLELLRPNVPESLRD